MSELRVFEPNEEFRSRGRNDSKKIDTGKYLRGIITGKWNGATEERALAENTSSAGGYLVPDVLADKIINKARSQNTLIRSGARTIDLPNGNITLAKILSNPEVEIKEELATATDTDITFGSESMSLFTLFSMVTISDELLQDGKNVGQLVEQKISEAISNKMDFLGYLGTGTGEPLGIINNTDVNTHSLGTDGAVPDYDAWSYAVQEVRLNNAEPKATVYNPRTAGTLDRLKDSTGRPLEPNQSYKDLNKFVTNQIPNNFDQGAATDASVAVVGDFSNYLIGVHPSGMKIKTTETGGGALETGAYKIAVSMRVDFLATTPKDFTIIEGILSE